MGEDDVTLWSHRRLAAAIDKNFAVHFPWIDRLFGTYYGPPGAWPSGYGIVGDPVPEEYTAQVVYPLRSSQHE